MQNPELADFFINGCGRCNLYATPECKVHSWSKELEALRNIALTSGLVEEKKWSVPCYTWKGKNIVVLSALKDCATLSFFKGSLLADENKILVKAGENSHVARIFKSTSLDEIKAKEELLKQYIQEAIELEKAGVSVKKVEHDLSYPPELEDVFTQNPDLQAAFEALTPGRKRSYLLHFREAKQSKTVYSRIEKSAEKIFSGKGFNEY